MIAYECLWDKGVRPFHVALDAPVQLEEVFVFKGGADGFPELVLCYGIHTVIGYDLGVVAVDYFAKMKAWGE